MISESKIVVRYAETDQMGILHHSVYPVWYEVARTDFIQKAGMRYDVMEKMGFWLPVIEVTGKYHATTTYGDELRVTAQINMLTPSKIEFLYKVYKVESDNPVNEGTTLHPFTSERLKPLNIRKHAPDIFELLKSACEPNTKTKHMGRG